jgi:anti-sigma factor RsiW
MNHPGTEELNEHVDGELPAPRRAEIDRHLETCADCRREREALASVVAAAASLPREIAPTRDLWPDILLKHARRPVRRRWPVAAAAAAAVVASGATFLAMRGTTPPEAAAQSEAERAVEELRAALAARRLDPRTAAAVEQNLQIIDGAIRDIRTALRSAPANGELQRMLADAYRAKVRLLQQTVYLTRTDERG